MFITLVVNAEFIPDLATDGHVDWYKSYEISVEQDNIEDLGNKAWGLVPDKDYFLESVPYVRMRARTYGGSIVHEE